MEKVTLFSHILPEEQERMRVCFRMREAVYQNNEIIMEYTSIDEKNRSDSGRAGISLWK